MWDFELLLNERYNCSTNRRLISQNGTTFVAEFWHFTEMVYFSPILVLFLYYFFSSFAQIGCIVFKATFCIGTFWRQKVKRGLNFGEV